MKNLLEVSNIMFKDKSNWGKVTDEEKSAYFFIFNRYFSKKYPDFSQVLNSKEIDKSLGMDLWFNFMKDKPYPQWFWSKSEKKSDKGEISEKHINKILETYDLKRDEFDFILKYYPEEIKEEIQYIEANEKSKK